ncbi:MAG: restriction endonuclease subunit S [Ectothiorhodospiraceae bacterium]|nr:restriction endonuclease subunit S [Ectothiorhodospiraceae bacterium]
MVQRELPPEWLHIQLGEVVSYGKTRKCVLEDVIDDTWVLELEDIEKESSKILSRKTAKDRPFKSTKNRFEEGNVLYGKLRPYLSKVVVADTAGVCSTEIVPLDAEPFALNRYLFHWLKTRNFLNYVNEVSYGVNMPRLGTKDGVAAPFVLAPLAEQKVIADKLDTLLAQVENTKARLERIPQILKRFRQSVLAAAVSGRLTEDFNADDWDYYQTIDLEIAKDKKLAKIAPPTKDEIALASELFESPDWSGWKLYALDQLVESARGIPYGIIQTGEDQEEGIPTIRCGDVKPLHIETLFLKKVLPMIEEKHIKTRLNGGEVVLAIRGTVGNAAVIPEKLAVQPLNISREVAMVPVRNSISPEYVALLLQSPGGYRALAEKTKGVAQRGINLADVKRLVTPLPTKSEQTEIVRRVDQLFAHADRIEKQVNNGLTRVNNLTQSILAKAFRGELTEQWRKDNPALISGENSAEALLERIKSERAAMNPGARRRKRTMA